MNIIIKTTWVLQLNTHHILKHQQLPTAQPAMYVKSPLKGIVGKMLPFQ